MIFEKIKSQNSTTIAIRDAASALSYGRLVNEITNRAHSLQNVRVLALSLDNSIEWILWDLAALYAGVPCVPLPLFFTQDQIFHVLQSAGVTHIISPEGLRDTGLEGTAALPQGTAKITFTSGTTGTPKGVCLSQGAMENVAGSIVAVLGDKFVGNHASVLPLAVLLENVAGVYAGLMAGCTIQLTPLRSFGQQYENIHSVLKGVEATSAILVPEILRILMAQVAVNGPLPKLHFLAVGGSRVDPALIEAARQMGLPVYEGYGLSECSSVVSLNTPTDDNLGSVGKILPHIKADIKDGEIVIHGPGFLGYIGEAAPNSFATGDLGAIDENGYLHVTGRKKNVLITSYGRNISPEWVESTLLTIPAIAQVIVYGDDAPHLSALIVPSSPQADIESALVRANQRLPDYAQIKEFRIVPPFTTAEETLTGTGRPRREKILNLYTQEKDNEFLRSIG
ncbi:MAG: AMP-binding protein [Micavibrio sp.]